MSPVSITSAQNLSSINSRGNDAGYQQSLDLVRTGLFELADLWKASKTSDADVYKVLASAVMPEPRPTELFLYPSKLTPSGQNEFNPQSIGRLLAETAQRAGKLDELVARVEKRMDQPRARLAANVLLAQIAVVAGDQEQINVRMEALRDALGNSPTQYNAELACHVALPGMTNAVTRDLSLPIVEKAATMLASGVTTRSVNPEPAATLLLLAGRNRLAIGDLKVGQQHLKQFLQVHMPNNSRYSSATRRRRGQLEQVIAELMKGGVFKEAIPYLGEHADLSGEYNWNSRVGECAAPLLRHVAAEPAEARYQMLRSWCMPTKGRRSIRMINAFLPRPAPPQDFAVAVTKAGTAADANPFVTPSVGPLKSIGSTGAMLVSTAAEVGKLDELTVELRKLAAEMLLIAELESGNFTVANKLLAEHAKRLKGKRPVSADQTWLASLSLYVAAIKALDQKATANQAGAVFTAMLRYAKTLQVMGVRAHLHEAIAETRRVRFCEEQTALLSDAGLKHWRAFGLDHAVAHASGAPRGSWIEVDGVLANVCSPHDSVMQFRYPLTGSFEVSGQFRDGDWSESGLQYDGIYVKPYGYAKRIDIQPTVRDGIERKNLDVMRITSRGNWNRIRMVVSPGRTKTYVNGHLVYDTENRSSSPWLGLWAETSFTPRVYDLKISGNPTIPREVRLLDDPRMRGWDSYYYRESLPNVFGSANPNNESDTESATEPDWAWRNGELVAKRAFATGSADGMPVAQSRVRYQRPIDSGDRLTYEFFYEPNRTVVHPMIGKLAILLRPNGTRLHWITDGTRDSFGLPTDHEIEDPVGAFSKQELPLNADDWNQVELTREGNVFRVSLNSAPIFERPLDAGNEPLFGFYRDRNREKCHVRNLVLSGDWPETLTDDIRNDLLARRGAKETVGELQAKQIFVGETIFSDMSKSIVERSRRMADDEARFQFLRSWVLPRSAKTGRASIRVYLDFARNWSAPATVEDAKGTQHTIERGGQPVSPAQELMIARRNWGGSMNCDRKLKPTSRVTSHHN